MTIENTPFDQNLLEYISHAPELLARQASTGNFVYSDTDGLEFLERDYPCSITLHAENNVPAFEYGSVQVAFMAWKTKDLIAKEALQSMNATQARRYFEKNKPALRRDFNHVEPMLKIEKDFLYQKYSSKNLACVSQLIKLPRYGNIFIRGTGEPFDNSVLNYDLYQKLGHNLSGITTKRIRDEYNNASKNAAKVLKVL